jgi:hypothetical protein
MSSYDERRIAFLNFYAEALPQIFENHPELSLSLDVSDVTEKLISLIKVRESLPIPTSIGEAYLAAVRLLLELIGNKKVAILPLSTRGRVEWSQLLAIVKPASTEPLSPEELYSDVIKMYRENVVEFNQRRKDSLQFRERSDRAQALHLLTPQPLVSSQAE